MFVVLIRTAVLYLFITAGIRFLGKHQIGQLEPSELVLTLIIADLASVPMQDNGIPLLSGLIPIAVLLAMATFLSGLCTKSIRLRTLLVGRPSILIRNGVIQQAELRRTRFTIDELLEELRIQGYPNLQDVGYALLETNGQLSVLPVATAKPVTVEQMGIQVQETGLPVVLVSDGRLLSHNLHAAGLEEKWLQKQLQACGLSAPRDAFLVLLDESRNCTVIAKAGGKASSVKKTQNNANTSQSG